MYPHSTGSLKARFPYTGYPERGKYNNSVAFMIVFKSLEIRDKYIPEEGITSDLYNAKMEKVQPLLHEWMKMGTYTREWTDWVIH